MLTRVCVCEWLFTIGNALEYLYVDRPNRPLIEFLNFWGHLGCFTQLCCDVGSVHTL